ncbi:hypothetical protein [Chryseobacterium sp. R2A-55]|uniref:hypothetical protein n=1 Tax=Chryseobacterium sp. R2A-55 TaxID=2744445 RepID=UPI001F32BC7B|nr:hypothetical protein [Chryseobacterium sp. R2A-55]
MNYFFSQILLDLQDRISQEVPEIRYTDQNLGQLAKLGDTDQPPLAYPAVLIDFPNTVYSEMATNLQIGAVQISVLLVLDTYSQTWHNAPLEVREKGLEYLEIEQKLYKSLQGWNLDYFAPLSRTAIRSQNNNDVGLRVRELTFTTEYEDWTMNDDNFKEVKIAFNGSLKTN